MEQRLSSLGQHSVLQCSGAHSQSAVQQSFLCGLVLDCVCGVVGGSDMIGLLCALKCNIGAIWYCVCGH